MKSGSVVRALGSSGFAEVRASKRNQPRRRRALENLPALTFCEYLQRKGGMVGPGSAVGARPDGVVELFGQSCPSGVCLGPCFGKH